MKTMAAVLRGVGVDWEVTEIELDPPRTGEVLVKMAYAGICHSDEHFYTGDSVPPPDMEEMMRAAGVDVPDWFPMLGGHEGSGIVEEVGPGVTSLKPGDHVAISFLPACGSCRWCATGYTYLCDVGANLYSKDMTTDGTRRRHVAGPDGPEDLMAMMQVGTFSEYVVASERSLVKIHDWIPLEAASLVSCGVTTGFGSGSVAAGTQVGDTVVVIGVGGIGMNAVQGARIAGAKHIVAVDPNEFKREIAPSFGATHTAVDAGSAIELVKEITWGVMADRVILTPGVVPPDLVLTAMMLLRKGGTCVLTGMAKVTDLMVPMSLPDMVSSCKTLKGVLYGEMNPREAMPRLLSMYETGTLKLDELVTQRYKLDDINEAMRDLRAGRNIRGVIEF
ncbi:alcohol dehydrogenase B [Mycolicibacterium phlei]|jgi:NDMA-dependent alcohol dehydrogenase|uniref:alcohol dehydrogenase n=1 Tax=Mycolicibacterium phlei DSM 43239 = CCUG 21000 TaxID=1226750 RepID=A0A5N5VCV0_MYCPH|nr:NDMA-dependent alcohol dehydrogenase [Mycolicibacterium phlei]VEG11669.1 alcohol dehydrogenase B [Mycobacteroides chelonae]AMO63575.1 NDMA-dependent alcohol dehydrogenase [Mycolicibacterium phlei]KAB7759586.1 alcohol dehydrogenase [Mycolicibacterium phlei DSM 43239 = CCUG 21000]KXW68628.1 alcohol dehydrogenase [Mycolicibacterium phlei DSM 43239 = CCUG 21000]KXW78208.1 alcohol dehydrogenase [Mycolicibacterium phlei DSM 43071]